MNIVNRIVLSKRDYASMDELYLKLAQQIRLLLESENTVLIQERDEGKGTFTIDFYPSDGQIHPYWLVEDEWKAAVNQHMDLEIAHARKVIQAADATDNFMKKLGLDKFLEPDDSNDGGDGKNGNGGSGPVGDA